MLEDVGQIRLVKAGSGLLMVLDVLKEFHEDLEAGVGDVPHCVLEGPDDGVEDKLELSGWYAEERWEAVVVYGLQQRLI